MSLRPRRARRQAPPRRSRSAARSVASIAGLIAGLQLAGPTRADQPVSAIVDGRMVVHSAAGDGVLAVGLSKDWSKKLPGVTRAVIVVHGLSRAAVAYFATVAGLAPDNHSLVVAPQFLTRVDVAAHGLPAGILRWGRYEWAHGGGAEAPVAASSFEAIDAILLALADRAVLPDLTTIVLAGFSAGGQLVQRYAAVAADQRALADRGIALRYVVGSPSSYVYFGAERPRREGGFGAFAGAADCPQFNRWRYGFDGVLPDYAAPALQAGPAALERRYAGRDLIYLLGELDIDPNHKELDKSCAAEAQGPDRYARGVAYFAAMQARDGPVLKQRLWRAPGAGHQQDRVFASPCGRAALFDLPGCPGD
jgi:hypothetical protein